MNHVKQAALIGADVVTAPPATLKALVKHPLTDKGLRLSWPTGRRPARRSAERLDWTPPRSPRTVLAALDGGTPDRAFHRAWCDSFSEADAYAVTAKLRELRMARGEKPVGRKIGFTNRNIWAEYGVFQPIWGDVYDTTVRTSRRATGSTCRNCRSRASSRRSCSGLRAT